MAHPQESGSFQLARTAGRLALVSSPRSFRVPRLGVSVEDALLVNCAGVHPAHRLASARVRIRQRIQCSILIQSRSLAFARAVGGKERRRSGQFHIPSVSFLIPNSTALSLLHHLAITALASACSSAGTCSSMYDWYNFYHRRSHPRTCSRQDSQRPTSIDGGRGKAQGQA